MILFSKLHNLNIFYCPLKKKFIIFFFTIFFSVSTFNYIYFLKKGLFPKMISNAIWTTIAILLKNSSRVSILKKETVVAILYCHCIYGIRIRFTLLKKTLLLHPFHDIWHNFPTLALLTKIYFIPLSIPQGWQKWKWMINLNLYYWCAVIKPDFNKVEIFVL